MIKCMKERIYDEWCKGKDKSTPLQAWTGP